ncbi:hypothetical protein D3C73_1493650 [compost metagenome]
MVRTHHEVRGQNMNARKSIDRLVIGINVIHQLQEDGIIRNKRPRHIGLVGHIERVAEHMADNRAYDHSIIGVPVLKEEEYEG